ncbi:phosphoenolpyruvate synthase [Candidatus Pacearchaeota archaeon]|nr:phosphoenolpyruvate synthase [Candidatus Pacearchaeota archaeon]
MLKKEEAQFVKWFSELSNKDIAIAGGKGASLAEMYNLNVPVPPGFVITAQAYQHFIEKTGISARIKEILANLDEENTAELNEATKEIRRTIESQSLPQEIETQILEAYEILSEPQKDTANNLLEKDEAPFVAVRSSATTEDLADASFAGQQESFLNVRGNKELLEKVKKCMSSLFTPRATYYRTKKGFAHENSLLAVVIQKMVNSVKSGVMFSQNPTTKADHIIIEAVWGLGEGIVSGQIKPDHHVVSEDLENFKILETKIANKKIAIVKNEEGKNETIKLTPERSNQQVLSSYEIKTLAQLAQKLEEHYKKPQDIEFAIDAGGIYIVQSRPITTKFKESTETVEGEPILSGLAASPGVSSGPVKIVREMKDLEKIQNGDVLVTEMTNPDMVVAMQKSAAIITDEGGITSHAAIVSREMGIPAVVGTDEATKILKDGQIVTIDGNVGKVYEGKGKTKLKEVLPIIHGTKIKIKVIADLPEGALRASKSEVKSIGLTRLEGIIAIGGKHPFYFVKKGDMKEYVKLLSSNLKKIAEPFEEIWVRSSDIRTDEYSNLEGAPKDDESNPMMGNHAIRFSLKHPEILKAELTAVKEVAEFFPNKKIGLMIPLVISVQEIKETKKIADEIGIPSNIKIGVMVETPAAVQIIEELCQEGIDFISFGTNDLTQFTLAIDRNNDEVAGIFDETHPAVVRSIQHVIRVCKKYNVETSICGQAGSRPEMARILAREGISSISVNADAAREISEIVYNIEKEQAQEFIQSAKQSLEPPEKNETESIEPAQKKSFFNQTQASAKHEEVINDQDMENLILQALENDEPERFETEQTPKIESEYETSEPEDNSDIPVLNDSIPIDSDSFIEETTNEIELADVEEWQGENSAKNQ